MSDTHSGSLAPFTKALTPRKEQRCENCAGYSARNDDVGMCCIGRPQAIMVGVAQIANANAEPVIHGFFPPVAKTCWCYEWTPRPDKW